VDYGKGAAQRIAAGLGAPGPANLVQVSVNGLLGGGGAADAVHFVITGIRSLEDSDRFPMTLTQWLTQARACFDATVQRQRKRIEEELEKARMSVHAVHRERIISGPTQPWEHVVFRPIWHEDLNRIEVLMAYKKTASYIGKTQRRRNPKTKKRRPPPPPTYHARYSVAFAARYISNGDRIRETEIFKPIIMAPNKVSRHVPWDVGVKY